MTPRYGSLCTGIGGLDLAVEAHFGAETAWCAEFEAALDPLIQSHFGPVLNLGDIKTVSWDELEPVDIVTAGYPCQPFSHAGKRKGEDDPRHLWPYIIEGVRTLRPRYVVLENVRGHLSLGFDTVLGDLAEAGFDAEWCVLRASDVGACHQRARVWIVATDARGERHGGGQDAGLVGRLGRRAEGEAQERQRPRQVALDRGAAAPADAHRGRLSEQQERDGEPDAGREPSLGDDPERLGALAWGEYGPAVHRWERALGRPAPRPVDDQGRLAPAFVEWMQGYPAGWVEGWLNRTNALKALGNAVVPHQALMALQELIPDAAKEVAA